ncbi:MAG: hypothetical protein JNM57_01095 [Cyclobacteriaceae bacterium]|nr:hypothetical protein [Cyclobacteriaceae bacterium]
MIAPHAGREKYFLLVQIFFILFFACLPLFTSLPYRVNIFLTWEGAYRLSIGQLPFRDFGMPLGYGFWLVPALFFKLFGPTLYALLLAQAAINIVCLATFRGILKLFGVTAVPLLVSIVVMGLTYTMVHFWPWYNHTVFVFELIGLYFLLSYLLKGQKTYLLLLSGFFIALTFFTKQDAGGLAIMLVLVLLLADALIEKRIRPLLIFGGAYVCSLLLFIVPCLQYDFTYWFNYGQSPHFTRLNGYDFLTTFFEDSGWLKFYIIAVLVVCIIRFKSLKAIVEDKVYFIFTLFTLGILVQALIIQVTSFSPPTTSYYYHSFAIAFLLYNLNSVIAFEKIWIAIAFVLFALIWQSDSYFKYSMRIIGKHLPAFLSPPPPSVVSKNTWSSKADSVRGVPVQWALSKYKTMRGIKLPVETINGLEAVESLDVFNHAKKLTCLNLSNLTPLAYEWSYAPQSGKTFPLWFHKGVAFFDRERDLLCNKVEQSEFDLILFEVMPDVDSFFPFEVRTCIQQHYQLVNSFLAPTGYRSDYIEVYIRKK